MNEKNKLTLKLDYSKPVELGDMSMALFALAGQFNRFSEKSPNGTPNTKFYLLSIENGSINAYLEAISSQLPVFNDGIGQVAEFVKTIKTLIGYFLGEKVDKPDFDKKKIEDLHTFLEPVAKDTGAMWTFTNCNIELNINYQQANAAQNAIRKEKELLEEPIAGFHDQVVIVFNQTRNSPITGNRATIESIYDLPVKTTFADDAIHSQMILNEENPLTGMYIVDVIVETVKKKPVLYKIKKFYERIE